jgi:hypothetical protein
MPPKRIRGPGKVKKTKQTLLPGAHPLINDVVPVIPAHLDPTLRRAALEPPKSIEPKRYAWLWNYMPSEDPETRYYNKITGVMEWRCAYYEKR